MMAAVRGRPPISTRPRAKGRAAVIEATTAKKIRAGAAQRNSVMLSILPQNGQSNET